MASPSLALPGVLFVGEDERARLVAHLGPAAGWMLPKGISGWSTEVSVVARDALSEQVRRDAKIVMPEEQIPPAKMPLTHQAALKTPLVAVSSRLTRKLVEAGIRVHTVGADRVTSSFYYIAEGGDEPPVRVEGDLVAAVGAMLGDRADNAAIERVLDGLVDRLLRSLSKDRVSEVSLELAAALPRAAADGTGTQDVDLESFEKELSALVAGSEKYTTFLQEIANRIGGTNDRRVDIPLFGDARKISQGPFELTVGDQAVSLVTHERWLATGPLTEPVKAAAAPAPTAQKSPAPAPTAQKSPPPAPAAQKSPAPAPTAQKPPPPATVAQKTPAPVPAVQKTPAPAPAAQKTPAPAPAAQKTPPPATVAQKSPPPASVAQKTPEPKPAAPKSPGPMAVAASSGVPSPRPIATPPRPGSNPQIAKEATPAPAAAAKPAEAEKPKPEAEAPKAVPAAEPVVAKAEPAASAVKAPEPAASEKSKAAEESKASEPSAESKASEPSAKSKAAESKAEPSAKKAEGHPRDSRLATTQKVKRQEKGIPWLWILVLAAAAFAGYRFLGRG
jgi:hypothetical protein